MELPSRNDYNGQDILKQELKTISAGNQNLQVVRSITPNTLTYKGEKGVLEMYRRAIGNATEYIYMENLYLPIDI
jgi:hypothetical protein